MIAWMQRFLDVATNWPELELEVEIRLEAARVLGVRKDQRAVPRLLHAVTEGGPYQFVYIQVLGEIDDARAFEPLQTLLTAPEFMLRREVVMALRKIDNARAVDLFYEQLEGLPGAEGDRLAHTLAGTDLLNAACSLARKARASGDLHTLARAALAARNAQNEHRSRLDALRSGEGTLELGGEVEGQAASAGAAPDRANGKAGLDVIRKFESVLRNLARGR
jgi:HEAT repeat protein